MNNIWKWGGILSGLVAVAAMYFALNVILTTEKNNCNDLLYLPKVEASGGVIRVEALLGCRLVMDTDKFLQMEDHLVERADGRFVSVVSTGPFFVVYNGQVFEAKRIEDKVKHGDGPWQIEVSYRAPADFDGFLNAKHVRLMSCSEPMVADSVDTLLIYPCPFEGQ